jgi:hypothetical protein
MRYVSKQPRVLAHHVISCLIDNLPFQPFGKVRGAEAQYQQKVARGNLGIRSNFWRNNPEIILRHNPWPFRGHWANMLSLFSGSHSHTSLQFQATDTCLHKVQASNQKAPFTLHTVNLATRGSEYTAQRHLTCIFQVSLLLPPYGRLLTSSYTPFLL